MKTSYVDSQKISDVPFRNRQEGQMVSQVSSQGGTVSDYKVIVTMSPCSVVGRLFVMSSMAESRSLERSIETRASIQLIIAPSLSRVAVTTSLARKNHLQKN